MQSLLNAKNSSNFVSRKYMLILIAGMEKPKNISFKYAHNTRKTKFKMAIQK